jgi:hypothetical protein
MANKKSYWLGEKVGSRRVGQISIAGKSYGIGESIPADKLDKKKLNQLREDGCIGDAPFHVPDKAADDAKDKDIALLQGRVAELEEQAVKDGDTIAGLELDLEAAGGEDVSALKIRVAELEPECELLTTDNEEKAALIKEQKEKIKEQKAEIKALKEAAKEAAK